MTLWLVCILSSRTFEIVLASGRLESRPIEQLFDSPLLHGKGLAIPLIFLRIAFSLFGFEAL